MKRIATVIIALLVTTVIGAQEISFGGWLETTGVLYTQSGDDDAQTSFTANEFGVDIKLNSESFGAQFGFGGWSEADWSASGISTRQAFIWTDFETSGMFKLYAGNDMEVIDYSPSPVEGTLFNDAFGLGLGKYNYQAQGNGYTGSKDGLIAELNTNGFAAAVTYTVDPLASWSLNAGDDTYDFDEQIADAFVLNTRYALDSVGTFYAGFAPMEDDGAFWVAADITTIPNVKAQIKLEQTLEEDADDQQTWISANLGYTVPDVVSIASETTYTMSNETTGNDLFVGLQVNPTVPVVGLSLEGSFANNDNNDYSSLGGAAKVSKGVGNVTTYAIAKYTITTEDDADGTFTFSYGMNMWY